MRRTSQVLLLEDIDELGHGGDVVNVRPGYARNFLIPEEKAVYPDARTLQWQAKLKEERAKRAVIEKAASEELAAKLNPMQLTLRVKVDQEGHLYGSVSAIDIVHLLEKEGIKIERKNVILPGVIKMLGEQKISLRLKEGVIASFQLTIAAEEVKEKK